MFHRSCQHTPVLITLLVLSLVLLDCAVVVHESEGALVRRIDVALGALVSRTEIA